MTEGKTKRNNFACLASLFSQGVTEPAVWYPLETLHMCWLEPVPCHLQSLLLLCLRATQSMETLSDIEAQSALWEEGVVLRETCPHPLDGSSQGALSGVCPTPGVCLGPPRAASPGAGHPGYFLFISWSTTSCLFGQIGLKIIRHWGKTCGLQQAVQALSDSLGLALCVQQEITVYFNGFSQLFAVLFWKCAVP